MAGICIPDTFLGDAHFCPAQKNQENNFPAWHPTKDGEFLGLHVNNTLLAPEDNPGMNELITA